MKQVISSVQVPINELHNFDRSYWKTPKLVVQENYRGYSSSSSCLFSVLQLKSNFVGLLNIYEDGKRPMLVPPPPQFTSHIYDVQRVSGGIARCKPT